MAIALPSSILVGGRFPTDDKYWVASYSNLNDGEIYEGMPRWTKDTGDLYILQQDSSWQKLSDNAVTITVNSVIEGNVASVTNSGTPQDVLLDFVLPKGENGEAATLNITSIEISPDSNFYIFNDGDQYNASYRLFIPAGPQGEQGPSFTIDAFGTFAEREIYDGKDENFNYLVDEPGNINDGKYYRKLSLDDGDWSTGTPFKGTRGDSIWIAYADTYDGIGKTFTPDSNKRFISFIGALTQPALSAFTTWLPITSNPSGFVTIQELHDELAAYTLEDLSNVDTTGVVDGQTLIYRGSDGLWIPGEGSGGGAVDSVNGQTGVVVLNQDNIGDGTTYKRYSQTEKTKLAAITGTNTGDETVTTIGTLINGATTKSTPVDADQIGLMDSAASNILKKLSWANIKATLKSYFDTLYNPTEVYGTITYSSSISIDFNTTATTQIISATGNLTITGTTNRAQGKSKRLRITNTTGSPINLSYPSWVTYGLVPSSIGPNKTLIITLDCISSTQTTEAGVDAGFATNN